MESRLSRALDGIMTPTSGRKRCRGLFLAGMVLALSSQAWGRDRIFYIVNNLNIPVWMAAIGRPNPDFGTGYAPPHTVIELKVPDTWSSARVWARTGCDFTKPGNLCETGDCGSGRADCAGLSGEPPVTLAEMTLGTTDFYDISNVDGYNLPMQMVPVAHTFEPLSPTFDPKKAMYYCEQTGCFSDLNQQCLPQNKQINGLGQTVACTNTVTVEAGRKNISEYATDEYKLFKGACPDAYAFPYDDAASTFVCNGHPDYKIIFGSDTATNLAPLITFKNPVNNQNFAQADQITIQAHIEDLDGAITEYEFFAENVSLGGKKPGAEGDFSQTWTPPGPGTYTLAITAKDNEGLSKTEKIRVTVGATTKLPLPMPTATPGDGTVRSSNFQVALNEEVAGATIYYTTDGSPPTPSSAIYKDSIPVSDNTYIRAIAVKDGYSDSPELKARYSLQLPKLPKPIANPASRSFSQTFQVALSDSLPSAVIRYTTDGQVPTESSPIYSGPITVSATTAIRAIAFSPGYLKSDPMIEVYTRRKANAISGYYLDKDGDGRIETAVVAFDSNYRAPPNSIAFADPFMKANKVGPAGITVANSTVTYALDPSKPFTPGTGFPSEPLGDIVADSNYAAQSVLMDDRVGPVLNSATSFPTAKSDASAEVEITFSEAVALDSTPPVFPLEVKRQGTIVADAEIKVIAIRALSPYSYRVVFAPASKYPVPGDSARITSLRPLKDAIGNRSNMRIFVPVNGSLAKDTVDLSYKLKTGLTENLLRPAIGPVANPVFIHGEKICIGCDSPRIRELLPDMNPDLLSTVGPTWVVTTKYPFDFTMMFYDNLGQYLNKAQGGISVADFDLLKTTESVAGDSVAVQLTFLPFSREGNPLGTGAYIMRGYLRIHDIQGVQGSQGESIILIPVNKRISSRFGFLRSR